MTPFSLNMMFLRSRLINAQKVIETFGKVDIVFNNVELQPLTMRARNKQDKAMDTDRRGYGNHTPCKHEDHGGSLSISLLRLIRPTFYQRSHMARLRPNHTTCTKIMMVLVNSIIHVQFRLNG